MADQELFDGEIKTVIEDDENLSFRKPNPATAGSRVISWANFKTVLNSLYVSLTGSQIINGIKQFISSPTVPDPTTDLQAVNLRTLLSKTTDPNFIDFVPQDPIPSFKLGRMFYDDTENTWTFFNDIEGISLQLGEELRARLTNDTGGTLLDGKAVSVTGAVGLSLQVELMDASDIDSSIRGFGLMTLDVDDGQPGYAVRYGAVRGLNTSSLTVGDIVYGDPENPGELTTIRPTSPNYPIRIGICLISDAINGLIGVDNLAFNGSDSSINMEGSINGTVTQTPNISFDASSGDIIATVTNEAFPAKMLPFLIDGKRYLFDTITSPQTIIIPPGLSSTETEESILYIKLNAGVPELAVTTATTISEPFAILSVQTVFNAARTDLDGKPLSYRRYNNAMDSLAEGVAGSFGLINVITNWIRLRGGAGWTSGQDGTPTVDNSNIKLAMSAGIGGQLHRSNLPLFDGNNYLIYNDNANAITYEPSTNLTDITETSAGVTLLNNNVYYPIKLYYLLNSNGVGNDVIATRPSGFYTTEDEAKSDALKYGTSLADPKTELNSYAVYTMIIGRTGGGGATITLIELQNNRKRTLKGDEGGGGAGGAGGTDDKVRVSAADTTNNYLNDKIIDSDSITKEIINPGADEQLKLNVKAEINAWYVNTNGSNLSGNGGPQKPFETIQAAITASSSGDIIFLQNVITEASITAPKTLTIFSLHPDINDIGAIIIDTTSNDVSLYLTNISIFNLLFDISKIGSNISKLYAFNSELSSFAGNCVVDEVSLNNCYNIVFTQITASTLVAVIGSTLQAGSITVTGGSGLIRWGSSDVSVVGTDIDFSGGNRNFTVKNCYINIGGDLKLGTGNLIEEGSRINIGGTRTVGTRTLDANKPNFGGEDIKTLSTGIITTLDSYNLIIASESGTVDDMIELIGLTIGDKVLLRADTGDTITVKHNDAGATIKILLQSGVDFVLDEQHPLELTLANNSKLVQDDSNSLNKVTTSDQTIASNVEFLGQASANDDTVKTFSATQTFNFNEGNDQEMPVTGNVTSFATSNSVGSANYKVWLINDATAGRTVAAPTGWTKASSSDDHDTAADAINLYQFFTRPGGTKYYSILNI